MSPAARLDRVLRTLPARYRGPGGAVAVLQRGQVVAQRTWGWADAARRIAFTPRTMVLVCSITKQFTCSLLLDQFPDPGALDDDVSALLPALQVPPPSVLQLCHNQSGLRDYWALAMLCGAPAEGVFGPEQAVRLIARARTLQFAPGTCYSYCNQNFRLLADIIERRTGQAFGDLLRRRILDPAGMAGAVFNPDASQAPGGTLGYEGSPAEGFRPATNRIHWTGDAGLAACLDDMIAWEQQIDRTRDDPGGLYRRLAAPQAFADGTPAAYGFGLAHGRMHGCAVTSHAGGLRGWRSYRLYAPAERVSVVVLFNHMADPGCAASDMLGALLDAPERAKAETAAEGFQGRFIEPESGLAVRTRGRPDGRLMLRYSPRPDLLAADGDGYADETTRLTRAGGVVLMQRPGENVTSRLRLVRGPSKADIEGMFHCDELDADLGIVASGGALYAACSGDLGEGEMQPLLPFGTDHWLMPCARALDYAAPGDWTLSVRRDEAGHAAGLQVGCWLARRIDYRRTDPGA